MSENALKMLVETYGYDGNQSGIIISKIESGEKTDVASENGVYMFLTVT